MAKKEPLDETWEVWLNTLLANPTGPPTIALAIGAFFGFKLIAPKLNLAFQGTEQALKDLDEKLKQLYDEEIVKPLEPAAKLASDVKSCFNSALIDLPWGRRGWVPGLSEPRFLLCMGGKGYAPDVIRETLRKL